MPSDPSGAIPKGSLARHPADWFDDNMATVAYTNAIVISGPTTGWATMSLFNNANTGIVLKVWGITADFDGGDSAFFWWSKAPLGNLVSAANAIRPDLGQPYGQLYAQQSSQPNPGSNPFYTGPFAFAIGTSGYDSLTVCSPFPLAIIPVGWYLNCTNPFSSCLTFGVSFWYQQCNE